MKNKYAHVQSKINMGSRSGSQTDLTQKPNKRPSSASGPSNTGTAAAPKQLSRPQSGVKINNLKLKAPVNKEMSKIPRPTAISSAQPKKLTMNKKSSDIKLNQDIMSETDKSF